MVTLKRIAILGATSHIAKGLIYLFSRNHAHKLHLFARSPDRVKAFVNDYYGDSPCFIYTFDDFSAHDYEVIINCVGLGDPGKLKDAPHTVFEVTERFDSMVLEYCKSNPEVLYIYLSSGAAYCSDFSSPADKGTISQILLNSVRPEQYYGLSKLYTETKHRSLTGLNIVDIRVFSYISRFVDIASNFFIVDIVNALREEKVLMVTADDVIRDYCCPRDLAHLVQQCMRVGTINDSFDLYSNGPINKFGVLDYFAGEYSLRYSIVEDRNLNSPTGNKAHYYSLHKKASSIGYVPTADSLGNIKKEVGIILKNC